MTNQYNLPEPEAEKVLNGPHEGFSADLETNLTLMKSKLFSDRLKYKLLTVGKVNPKKLAIAYFEGRADQQLLGRLINKIDRSAATRPQAVVDSARAGWQCHLQPPCVHGCRSWRRPPGFE